MMKNLFVKNMRLMAVLAVLIMLFGAAGCNLPAGEGVPESTPTIELIIAPTATLDWAAMSPMQRYVTLSRQMNAAPDGLPVIVTMQSEGKGARQQVDYFKQVFTKAYKDKKINILTQKATYGRRGLFSGEKIENIIAFQYKDGLASAFILTNEKNGKHTYFIDPQGAVYELYLVAENTTPEAFFERNAASAVAILSSANLSHAQWVAVRQVTQEAWSQFDAGQQDLLQSQYAMFRLPEQPALLKDAVLTGTPWVLLPVLLWDGMGENTTVLMNPSSLALHLELNPLYQPSSSLRGVMLGLPVGLVSDSAEVAVEPQISEPSPTVKAAATKKAGKATATPTSAPVVDNSLKKNMEAYESGQVMVSNEKLFRTSTGINPLGIADSRDVGMSWGFFVQAVYLGSTDVQMKGYKAKVRVAVFGFQDGAGNHYFIPCQLGVDLDHPVIIQYDSNRTISSIDNERPLTMQAGETLDVLRVNLNEPVLIFLMRSAPPFPLSDSDGYYIKVHEKQYPVADLALRFIKAAAAGDSQQIQAPDIVNSYNLTSRILPLVENIILPNKLPK